MRFYRLVLFGLVALGLATGACGPLPRAFKPDHKPLSNAFHQLEDVEGVVVGRIEGVPDDLTMPLAEKLVENFHKADIPASTSRAHRHGHLLTGKAKLGPATGKRRHLVIDWRLSDKNGKEIGVRTTRHRVRARNWEKGSEAVLQRVALRSVSEIATLFRSNPNHTAPAKLPNSVVVRAVDGAPGDGGTVLPIAIRSVLRQAGVTVKDTLSEANLSLGAQIKVDPDTAAHDRVTIVWEFKDKAGSVVRRMRQSNKIPKGRLSQPWGSLAYDIALAMRGSVRDTLAALPDDGVPEASRARMRATDRAQDRKDSKPSAAESVDALLLRLENTQIFAPRRNLKKARGERFLEDLERTRINEKP